MKSRLLKLDNGVVDEDPVSRLQRLAPWARAFASPSRVVVAARVDLDLPLGDDARFVLYREDVEAFNVPSLAV